MADKLTQMFESWQASVGEDANLYQAYAAGVTAGAVSMRERAIAAAQKEKGKNQIVNAIGQLSDIPPED